MISGGMDNLLCYWDAKGVRCDTLMGHQGSVTKVMTDQTSTAISGSYDGTMIIWNLGGLDEARKLFGPHKQAIMDFDWKNSLVVSGDRQGVVAFWDINEGEAISQKKVHNGAVSQTVLYSDGGSNNIIITAGINDGVLAVHDMRQNKLVCANQIHKGAINSVKVNMQNFSKNVVQLEYVQLSLVVLMVEQDQQIQ